MKEQKLPIAFSLPLPSRISSDIIAVEIQRNRVHVHPIFRPLPPRQRQCRMQSLSSSLKRSLVRARVSNATLRYASSQTSSSNSDQQKTTSFGFQTIPEEAKESLVKNVFDSVASKYDLMNDASSLGVHRLWKDQFVTDLKPGRNGPLKCLDVAGGTGDIALRILDYAREKYADRETTVEVVDINAQMLKEGYRRFKQTMYHNSQLSNLF